MMKPLFLVLTLLAGFSAFAQVSDEEKLHITIKVNELKDNDYQANVQDLCFARSERLDSLVAVAGFVNDRGCALDYVYWHGEAYYVKDAAKKILPLQPTPKDAGIPDWPEQWTRDVELVFVSVLDEEPEDWNKTGEAPGFVPISVEQEGNEYVVRVWVQMEMGMLPQADYRRWEYRYNINGLLYERKSIGNHSVSLWPPKPPKDQK